MLFTVAIVVFCVAQLGECKRAKTGLFPICLRSKTSLYRAAIDKKSSNTMDLGVQKRSCNSCILLVSFSTSKKSLIFILFLFSYDCAPSLLADWMLFVLPVANPRHYVCWHVHTTQT